MSEYVVSQTSDRVRQRDTLRSRPGDPTTDVGDTSFASECPLDDRPLRVLDWEPTDVAFGA
jgi:hypothetical protein